ncbi:TerB family tellurite resistance protein [Agaribacterium haliotis]|uniref:tellurite resistance TerB family protein n=1 Tax=Agaribacterium haliotis TaxID=2013869 RepID=UPI000BB59F88|nr:TerB family tellurite resistance protein [Agaribacterium haliotis]
MFTALKALFADGADPVPDEHAIQLACAALLVEVASIDGHFDKQEQQKLVETLKRRYQLSTEESLELQQHAQAERKDATSLHQFTRLINEHRSNEKKFSLLVDMWKIAYADGQLDKYEEHIIRRIADLLHLGHSQFIQAKLQAKPS